LSFILTVRFELQWGSVDQFEDAMSRLVPAVVEQGWQLLSATRSVTGPEPLVMHIYEIPDAESVHGVPARAFAAHPELADDARVLGETIKREELALMSRLSYDPAA
jgi:hypothetical protein